MLLSMRARFFIFSCLSLMGFVHPATAVDLQTPEAKKFRLPLGNGEELYVVPLDFQKGLQLPPMGPVDAISPSRDKWLQDIGESLPLGQLLDCSTGSYSKLIRNPIALFGSMADCPPLYEGQSYRFAFYPGVILNNSYEDLIIYVYDRTQLSGNIGPEGLQPVKVEHINLPGYQDITAFGNAGFQASVLTTVGNSENVVLETKIQVETLNKSTVNTNLGYQSPLLITHKCLNSQYVFFIGSKSYNIANKTVHNTVIDRDSAQSNPVFGYAVNFDPVSPWETTLLRTPNFQGQPAPPAYLGKTAAEIAAVPASTSSIDVTLPSWHPNEATMHPFLRIDFEPELRKHIELDRLAAKLETPLNIANYVFNEIGLVDAVSYNEEGKVDERSVNAGGMTRDALAVYMEGQGSPAEQCALLTYLLRKSGYYAAYVKPAHNAIKMDAQRLSNLLRMRIKDAMTPTGQVLSDSMISVNYPWVVFFDPAANRWVHLFPWLKDTEVVEGQAIEGYIPGGQSITSWVRNYLLNPDSLNSPLQLDKENQTPGHLFMLDLQKTLNPKGLSISQVGVNFRDRKHLRDSWDKFPTPPVITPVGTLIAGTSTPASYAISSKLADSTSPADPLYDLVEISLIGEGGDPQNINIQKKIQQTVTVRVMDLHNRKAVLQTEVAGGNSFGQAQMDVVLKLDPYDIGDFSGTSEDTFKYYTRPIDPPINGPIQLPDIRFQERPWTGLTMRNGQKKSLRVWSSSPVQISIRYIRHRRFQPAFSLEQDQLKNGGWAHYLGIRNIDLGTNRAEAAPTVSEYKAGSLSTLCLNTGRVTSKMVELHVRRYRDLQKKKGIGTSSVSHLTPEEFDSLQSSLPYIMGMTYYQRLSESVSKLSNLFKINMLSMHAHGFSTLEAASLTPVTFTLGTDPVSSEPIVVTRYSQTKPALDMMFMRSGWAYDDLRADAGGQSKFAGSEFLRSLWIAEISAQEHHTIKEFYPQSDTDAISTVNLLHRSQKQLQYATASVSLKADGNPLIRFQAVAAGSGGNDIKIKLENNSDYPDGDKPAGFYTKVTIDGDTINILLDSRENFQTSAAQVIESINNPASPAKTKITAYMMDGIPSAKIRMTEMQTITLRGGGVSKSIVELSAADYLAKGNQIFADAYGQSKSLRDWCGESTWKSIVSAFESSDKVKVFVTPGAITGANGEWHGMGTLILGGDASAALIGRMSGGAGSTVGNQSVPYFSLDFSFMGVRVEGSVFLQFNQQGFAVAGNLQIENIAGVSMGFKAAPQTNYSSGIYVGDGYYATPFTLPDITTFFNPYFPTQQIVQPSGSSNGLSGSAYADTYNNQNPLPQGQMPQQSYPPLSGSMSWDTPAPSSRLPIGSPINPNPFTFPSNTWPSSSTSRGMSPAPRSNPGIQPGISPRFADPVNVMTGHFYEDVVDLVMPGPIPLQLRRNYNSGSAGVYGEFGFGWRLAYVPYLYLSDPLPDNASYGYPSKIHATEMDGTMVVYSYHYDPTPVVEQARHSWIVKRAENPFLSNGTAFSMGSANNLFLNKITINGLSGGNIYQYKLMGADSAYRIFSVMEFPENGNSTNTRKRPYLTSWWDGKGNSLNFNFNSATLSNGESNPGYGQLDSVSSNSGAGLSFHYDNEGRLVEVSTSDGRRVKYFYDMFGDLTKVLLPDLGWAEYQYLHEEQFIHPALTGPSDPKEWYSKHLIEKQIQPGGRVLKNEYEKYALGDLDEMNKAISTANQNAYKVGYASHKARVKKQYAAVGKHTGTVSKDVPAAESYDLVLNAEFVYVQVESGIGWISGLTAIKDAYGQRTVYHYENSRITAVDDPLTTVTGTVSGSPPVDNRVVHNRKVLQNWYTESDLVANPPLEGAWPGALKSIQERGKPLVEFFYDGKGNLKLSRTTGELDGDIATSNDVQETWYDYNANNLLTTVVYPKSSGINAGRAVQNPLGVAPTYLGASKIYEYGTESLAFCVTQVKSYSESGALVSRQTTGYNSFSDVAGRSAYRLPYLFKVYSGLDEGSLEAETTVSYNGRGHPTRETTRSLSSDLSKHPNAITDFTYNQRGELVEKRVMGVGGVTAQKITCYAYDDLGRPIWEEQLDSTRKQLAWNYNYYNLNGDVEWTDGSKTNPEDYAYSRYDGAGRVVETVGWRSRAKADGSGVEEVPGAEKYSTSRYFYNMLGDLVKVMDARGNTTKAIYDGIGRKLEAEVWEGDWEASGAKKLAVSRTIYDDAARTIIQIDAQGAKTKVYLTSLGQPYRVEKSDGTVQTWTYYMDGRPKRLPASPLTYFEIVYNDAQRTVTKELKNSNGVRLGEPESFKTDARGNLVESTTMNGLRSRNYYDGVGRVTRTVSPVDASGAPLALASGPAQDISYTYDAADLSQTLTNAKGEKIKADKDAVGRPVLVDMFDANGSILRRTGYAYSTDFNSVTTTVGAGTAVPMINTVWTDTAGQTVLVKHGAAASAEKFVRAEYDIVGNPVSSIDELGKASSSSFDALGRPTEVIQPGGAKTDFAYSYLPWSYNETTGVVVGGGSRTKQFMPGGLKNIQVADQTGRPVETFLLGSDSPAEDTDLEGSQIDSAKIRRWTRGFEFYGAGETNTALGQFPGSLKSFVDSRSQANVFNYDDYGRASSVTIGSGATQISRVFAYAFNVGGQAVSMTETTGASGTEQTSTVVSRQMDLSGRLDSEKTTLNGVVISHFTQHYDSAGLRDSLQRGMEMSALEAGTHGGSWNFTYNAAGSLASVTTAGKAFSYVYDEFTGLLASKDNPFRTYDIDGAARDKRGRAGQVTTRLKGGRSSDVMRENISWNQDHTQSYLARWKQIDTGLDTDTNNVFQDSRGYTYDGASRLASESWEVREWGGVLSSPKQRSTTYQFDHGQAGGPGVRTRAYTAPQNTGNVAAPTIPLQMHEVTAGSPGSGLDPFSRVVTEISGMEDMPLMAYGTARGAASVDLSVSTRAADGTLPEFDSSKQLSPLFLDAGTKAGKGGWHVPLTLPAASYSLTAKANHPSGQFSSQTSLPFTLDASHVQIETTFDQAGEGLVTERNIGGGSRVQSLVWDAVGRLIQVTQMESTGHSYVWRAWYDGMNRRIRTSWTPSVNGTPNPAATVVQTSFYDPSVEFLEIGTQIERGQGAQTKRERWWKVHGPDLAGGYGGLNGIGGLEAVVNESSGECIGLLDDYHGHIVGFASLTGSPGIASVSLQWNSARFSGYGPVPGTWTPSVEDGHSYWRTLGWRGRRLDVTGFYYQGMRHYEPVSGRFLSPDPLGHGASMSLYDYAGGDPINMVDPSGRRGIATSDQGPKLSSGGPVGGDSTASSGGINFTDKGTWPDFDPFKIDHDTDHSYLDVDRGMEPLYALWGWVSGDGTTRNDIYTGSTFDAFVNHEVVRRNFETEQHHIREHIIADKGRKESYTLKMKNLQRIHLHPELAYYGKNMPGIPFFDWINTRLGTGGALISIQDGYVIVTNLGESDGFVNYSAVGSFTLAVEDNYRFNTPNETVQYLKESEVMGEHPYTGQPYVNSDNFTQNHAKAIADSVAHAVFGSPGYLFGHGPQNYSLVGRMNYYIRWDFRMPIKK